MYKTLKNIMVKDLIEILKIMDQDSIVCGVENTLDMTNESSSVRYTTFQLCKEEFTEYFDDNNVVSRNKIVVLV